MPGVVSTFPVMDSGFLNPIQGNHSLPITSNSVREPEAFSSIGFQPEHFSGNVRLHFIEQLTIFQS